MRAKSTVWSFTCAAFVSVPASADDTVQVLMRDKLEATHGILDAIAVADYAKIEKFASRLQMIGRATTWYRQESPDFLLFAKSFENTAVFLEKQAKNKDNEGVAMGYIRLTLDCIRCHNVVRALPKR
jgi:hypothetical protein